MNPRPSEIKCEVYKMEIKGKFNLAKIFTTVVDDGAIEQIQAMCDSEVFAGSKIRIMPDVHTGTSCTIGTTMTIIDKVVPSMVGVDIGCGMEVSQLAEKELDFEKLDKLIYATIPSGSDCRDTKHAYASKIDLSQLRCYRYIKNGLAYKSIGTLGAGNHFIEVDKDDEGNLYLVVHSGSRHLGVEVASYYQEEAYKQMCGCAKHQLMELIDAYKAQGRDNEIQTAIDALKANEISCPKDKAYLTGKLFDDYIHDMKIVQQFAVLNRQAMVDEIVSGLNLTVVDQFTTIHNYIDTDYMILRKGAISARKGEKVLIPINMRDGSLICIGKGNEDWNNSAPHGAGRILSRGKARATLTMEEFKSEMQGIYTTSVKRSTLDESPMAYKSLNDILSNVLDSVDVFKHIKPVYNFKASGDEEDE